MNHKTIHYNTTGAYFFVDMKLKLCPSKGKKSWHSWCTEIRHYAVSTLVSHAYWNIKDPVFPCSVCTACPPNYLALKLFSAKNSVNWTFVQTAPRVDNGERFTDPLFLLFWLIHLGQVIGDGWIEADEKRMEPCSLNHHRDGCSHGSGWGAVPVARRLAGSGLEVPLLYWTTRLTLRWPRIGPWPK